MGVPGLWHELAATGADRTLAELAAEHWNSNADAPRALRLGVDATLWLYHARKAQGGKNPALRALFFRLARLLKLPICPIFVLDGPRRPKIKRDVAVYTGTHAIQEQFCAMLDAFRYAYWTAPAEAEAELAWMNRTGRIDAVLTDDVDALLFGARVVVRNRAWRDDPPDDGAGSEDDEAMERAAVYDVQNCGSSLDAHGMVLIALLAGADYDTQGVARCGVKTAIGLAHAGFGTRLVEAFRNAFPDARAASHTSAKWEAFLDPFRSDLQKELASNASGHLPRRMPKLAATLPTQLFSTRTAREALSNYVWPTTSDTLPERSAALDHSLHVPPGVQLHALATYVAAQFQWAQDTLVQRFARVLFDGMLLQELRRTALEPTTSVPSLEQSPVRHITDYFARIQTHSPPQARRTSPIVRVHATRTMRWGVEVRVAYETRPYLAQLPPTAPASHLQRVWVPEPLLLAQGKHEQALYRTYCAQQRRKAQASPTKKGRSADQPKLTAFLVGTKPTARRAIAPAGNQPCTADAPAHGPLCEQAADVFGPVAVPPTPAASCRAPRHAHPQTPGKASPDTSVEFVGVRTADLSADTSVSSVESPRSLLLRVCQPGNVQ